MDVLSNDRYPEPSSDFRSLPSPFGVSGTSLPPGSTAGLIWRRSNRLDLLNEAVPRGRGLFRAPLWTMSVLACAEVLLATLARPPPVP